MLVEVGVGGGRNVCLYSLVEHLGLFRYKNLVTH